METRALADEIRRIARTSGGQFRHGYEDGLAELRRRAASGDLVAIEEIAATPSWRGDYTTTY